MLNEPNRTYLADISEPVAKLMVGWSLNLCIYHSNYKQIDPAFTFPGKNSVLKCDFS